MSIAPIGGIPPLLPMGASQAPDWATSPGGDFGRALGATLQNVSNLEHTVDAMVEDVATGGETKVHDVMIATSEAALAVDLLVQVRDRALEAYQEIMRLQL